MSFDIVLNYHGDLNETYINPVTCLLLSFKIIVSQRADLYDVGACGISYNE